MPCGNLIGIHLPLLPLGFRYVTCFTSPSSSNVCSDGSTSPASIREKVAVVLPQALAAFCRLPCLSRSLSTALCASVMLAYCHVLRVT